MIDNIQKLYGTIPVPVRHKVSLNVLFAEKSEIGDGIKKKSKPDSLKITITPHTTRGYSKNDCSTR